MIWTAWTTGVSDSRRWNRKDVVAGFVKGAVTLKPKKEEDLL